MTLLKPPSVIETSMKTPTEITFKNKNHLKQVNKSQLHQIFELH